MPEEVAYESIDDLEAATDAFHKIDSRQPDGEDPVEPQAAKTLSYQSLKELNAPLKFGDYPATEHETASDEQDLEDGESSDGSPRYLTGSYQHGETCEEEALYFEDYMPAGAEFPPLHAVHAQASHQTPCCDVFGANSRLRSGGGGAAHAQWVSDVCGLGRSIRALAVVDGCVLLASAVLLFWGPWFPMVFGLFCWGPIAGCWSGHRYSLPAARAYFVYYLFKIAADAIRLFMGGVWALIPLIFDCYIGKFVHLYCTLLSEATPRELGRLHALPDAPRETTRAYFILF